MSIRRPSVWTALFLSASGLLLSLDAWAEGTTNATPGGDRQASKAVEKSVEKPAEKSVGKPIDKPVEKSTSVKNAKASSTAGDVTLREKGILIGRLVDAQGRPVAKASVDLRVRDQVVAQAESNADGRVAFQNLRGGVYQLVASATHGTYRLWAPGTAPRVAQDEAVLVVVPSTVRGQQPPAQQSRVR